jgi:hypothetical protein
MHMRSSNWGGIIGLALLGLTASAGAAVLGNPCSPLTYGAVGDGTVGTNNGTWGSPSGCSLPLTAPSGDVQTRPLTNAPLVAQVASAAFASNNGLSSR